MCDGTKDCPNGDDESKDICTYFTCTDSEFRCKDFTCIPGDYFCNGKAECKDNSDELNCRKMSSHCIIILNLPMLNQLPF